MNIFRKKPYNFREIEDDIQNVLEDIKLKQLLKGVQSEYVLKNAYLEMKQKNSSLREDITIQLEKSGLKPQDKNITPIVDTILWYLNESRYSNFPPTPIEIEEHYNSLIEKRGGYRKKSKRHNKKSMRKGRKTYKRK